MQQRIGSRAYNALILVGGLALAMSPSVSLGWGPQGHQYSGAIADKRLTENARAQVQANLGIELRAAGAWADCVKDVVQSHGDGDFHYQPDPRYHASCGVCETPEGEAAMVDYVRRNWDN